MTRSGCDLDAARAGRYIFQMYTVVPGHFVPHWFTVLRDGEPVWHGPLDVCERYIMDPAFRRECHRNRMLHAVKPRLEP